jgi:acyl carrier protein
LRAELEIDEEQIEKMVTVDAIVKYITENKA